MILVTGTSGYIGSVVVEKLKERGHKVHELLGDITSYTAMYQELDDLYFDAVVHLAAVANVKAPAEECFETNVLGGINLLRLLKGKYKFIFASSAAVYGEPVYMIINEKNPCKPISPYGESKLIFEQILKWYGLSYIAFRLFNVAGATEKNGDTHSPETHLIPNILIAASTDTKVQINGSDYKTADGTCERDYVHVLDVAEAIIMAIENDYPSGAYNLGSNESFTNQEVIDLAEYVLGRTIKYEIVGRRNGDPSRLQADITKWQEVSGWKPKYSLEEIIRSQWEWMQ